MYEPVRREAYARKIDIPSLVGKRREMYTLQEQFNSVMNF
jgi:hypothetical protein